MNAIFDVAGTQIPADISTVIIAGWTGRDSAAVEHHIAELEALGVARPRTVPMFYRVSASLLTQDSAIEVVGPASSGEVEFVIVNIGGVLYVGVGSDHTDRAVETYGVTVSKQVCPKPISKSLWRLDAVREHWDRLILRSYVTRDGKRSLYQEGAVTRMLDPGDLLARLGGDHAALPQNTLMFCGTLPVIGALEGGELFEIELEDPVLGRTIRHQYAVHSLTIVD
ncbi:MAG: DUF2848 domain-containing protein [Pseudomonadota bacterium]